MPWCPKCKSEYRPEFDKCADCGAKLVPEMPEEVARNWVWDNQPSVLDRLPVPLRDILTIVAAWAVAALLIVVSFLWDALTHDGSPTRVWPFAIIAGGTGFVLGTWRKLPVQLSTVAIVWAVPAVAFAIYGFATQSLANLLLPVAFWTLPCAGIVIANQIARRACEWWRLVVFVAYVVALAMFTERWL